MAQLCLGMIEPDVDEQPFLNYLVPGFDRAAPGGMEGEEITRAKKFIEAQLSQWKNEGNEKLLGRYQILSQYYQRYRPTA